MLRLSLLVTTLLAKSTTALLAGPALLSKALGKKGGRPLIVHVWDPNPAALETFAIDDVSEACRTAGAAAVLCGLDMIGTISKEQELARGAFPGALPTIAEVALVDLVGEDGPAELCTKAKSLGATGIGIRYGEWQDESALEELLQQTVATANELGLGAILLPGFGSANADDEGTMGGGGLASRVGAAAGLSQTPETAEDGEALAFGCWDGEPEALQRLRDDGFRGLLLKNACRGDVAWGCKMKSPSYAAQALTRLVKASQSKGNTAVWGGAASATGGGGGQSAAAYARKDVQVPFELSAQMGNPAWAEK